MQLPAVCVTAGAKTQTIASIGIVHVREHFQLISYFNQGIHNLKWAVLPSLNHNNNTQRLLI